MGTREATAYHGSCSAVRHSTVDSIGPTYAMVAPTDQTIGMKAKPSARFVTSRSSPTALFITPNLLIY